MVLAAKQVIGALGTKLLMQSLPRRIRSETPDPLHFFQIFKEQPNETHGEAHSRLRLAVGSKDENRNTGGANRDRTGDLLLAKQALSQLSYGPRDRPCFRSCCSKTWSVPDLRFAWWVWVDLNHRPHAYQACALTN
jgi:hypothetical protein